MAVETYRPAVMPTMEELKFYEPVVKKVLAQVKFKGGVNIIFDMDDLEQEFWSCILLQWNYLLGGRTDKDKINKARFILKNCAIWFIHFYERRPDTSRYTKKLFASNVFDDEVNEYASELEDMKDVDLVSTASLFDTPEDTIFGKELFDLVMDYASKQTGKVKEFIQNLISPTKEIQDWWEDVLSTTPQYKRYRSIHPAVLSYRIFGDRKHHFKILEDLSIFLKKNGYSRVTV